MNISKINSAISTDAFRKVSVSEVLAFFDLQGFKPRNYKPIVKNYLVFIAQRDLPLTEFSKQSFLQWLKAEKEPKNLAAYQTPINKLLKACLNTKFAGCYVYQDERQKPIIETKLQALFEAFLRFADNAKTERTKEDYRKAFQLFCRFAGSKQVESFSRHIVLDYRANLLHQLEAGKLSAFTVNSYLSPLRQFAKYLLIEADNLFQDLETDKRQQFERDLSRIANLPNSAKIDHSDFYKDSLTPEEIALVLSRANNARDRLMIGLMAYAGLRTFEVLKVSLADFNTKEKTLSIQGKGAKRAQIPLTHCWETLHKLLNDYLTAHKKRAEGLLFPDVNSTSIIRSFVNKLLVRLDLKEKKKKVSCHSFRHSLAQNLLHKSVPLEAVQTILRHTNISTTEIYFKKIQSENRLQIPANLF
jgi:integrase/recombinase XerD